MCYISRSLSETEQRYAVIEKEALSVTWACERLSEYILGLQVTIETDHKPLVPLLNTIELYKMPPRIQRFRLRLMRYNTIVVHVAGKNQTTADTLSRSPASQPNQEDLIFLNEVTAFTQMCADSHSVSNLRLQQFRSEQKLDSEITQVRAYCQTGWPDYMPENYQLKPYWLKRSHFSIVDDLLLYDQRIVIPRSLRLDILDRLHQAHQGITKTRALATESVWWPCISNQIEEMIQKCFACAKNRPSIKEPLIPSSTPDRPWSRLGIDFLEFKNKTYLIVVDYYSRWIEFRQIKKLTSANTILQLKSIFSVHGIPDVIVSDNGPQFASFEFKKFAKDYGCIHTTSSPRYPQSNGEAERAVQTIKNIMKKSEDLYTAMLLYRATPLQNGFSPAELLMSRKLQTKVPILPKLLKPHTPHSPTFQGKEDVQKIKQRYYYNSRHRARPMSTLHPGSSVYVRDLDRHGIISAHHHNPRSYLIQTDQGKIRRNRSHLIDIQPGTLTDDSPGANQEDVASHLETDTPMKLTLETAPGSSKADGMDTQLTDGAILPAGLSTATKVSESCAHSTASGASPWYTTRAGRQIRRPQRLDY